jgi:hypothetical protein
LGCARGIYIRCSPSQKGVAVQKELFASRRRLLGEISRQVTARPAYWIAGIPERPVASPPEEIFPGSNYIEGSVTRITVNRYERDPHAREACITRYGARCFACKFNFGNTYGQAVDGFIHVHHLKALSTIGVQYEVDPIRDLRPLFPNCHAVIHRREPPYSIKELITLLQQNNNGRGAEQDIQPTRAKPHAADV